jgi:O-antigen/teichoic acid export membrane protein
MLKKIKDFLFKNTTAKQTVAKNTFWLSVSNFGGRLLKAIVIIYAARVLGTAGYGLFSYAVTLAGFLTLFMDPGINAVLMRESSTASEEKRKELFSTMLFLKIALLVFGLLVIIFIAPLFTTMPGAQALLPIVAFILMFDTSREFLLSVIRSREKMEWEAGIFIFTNFAIVVFGFAFLILHPSAKSLGYGYAFGTFLGAVAAIIVLRNQFKGVFSSFSQRLIGPTLQNAWPFAITGALGVLLTNTDILIISWMRSASDVGIYSAAIRVVQVLYIVPGIIQLSTLPFLSRLAANKESKKFRTAFERLLGVIFFTSIPLAIGGAILGTQIMTVVFGQAYASGGLAFKILMLSLLVDFPAVVISSAIFAYNHQKSLIVASAIGGGANVLFDIILIPRFGIAGSSIATLVAQIFSNWYLWHMMNTINRFAIFGRLKKIAIAGVAMGVVTAVLLASGVNIFVNILLSGGVYFLVLYALREPLVREMKNIIAPSASSA